MWAYHCLHTSKSPSFSIIMICWPWGFPHLFYAVFCCYDIVEESKATKTIKVWNLSINHPIWISSSLLQSCCICGAVKKHLASHDQFYYQDVYLTWKKALADLWETCILFCKQHQPSLAIAFISAVAFWAALGLNMINQFSNQDFFE